MIGLNGLFHGNGEQLKSNKQRVTAVFDGVMVY